VWTSSAVGNQVEGACAEVCAVEEQLCKEDDPLSVDRCRFEDSDSTG
jgi:hypothetical protein